MDAGIAQKAEKWANDTYFNQDFRGEIQELIEKKKDEELEDRFYKELEFGTGGMRGILGAGSNRMNIYTIRKATQGLADYINQQKSPQETETPSVAIAHDNRHFSDLFTREAASVLVGNRIRVHVFPSLRPTPMLSFAVRELQCTSGIVITASHNPSQYNGFKAYWSDGAQIISPHDKGIIDCVNLVQDFSRIDYTDYETALKEKWVEIIPASLDDKYYSLIDEQICFGSRENNRNFGVIYTPLHGTGNIPVREILKRRGFEKVTVVKEQELPDGDFPTVRFPNPEESSALEMAQKAGTESDQLILATDPDTDRLGAMSKENGKWEILNGNQIGQLMLDYYLEKLREQKALPKNGYYLTTIVTSELGKKIAKSYGLKQKETLTGFKYIASLMPDLEAVSGQFLFGTEESHGYLLGNFVRDKDAVSAAAVFAEMAAELSKRGISPLQRLEEIHQKFGYHLDSLLTQVYEGKSGAEKIQKIMKFLRENSPQSIGNFKVLRIKDYLEQKATGLPKSNVLAFYLEDGSRISVRPSGTEPKIKYYFNLCGKNREGLPETRKIYENSLIAMTENFL